MTRHFQGPWRVGGQNGNGHWVIRHKHPAIKIATVPWCGNARLIAAAPDLLDALRNFTDGRDISYVDALEAARAAIAKAAAA